jgi:ubiquinone biosynthesis accessory factor UbiJ
MCNHILRNEPLAMGRLAAHAGQTMVLTLPSLSAVLPLPEWLRSRVDGGSDLKVDEVRWLISRAGLLDRVSELDAGDVAGTPALAVGARLDLRGTSPLAAARALATGDTGVIDVQGDADHTALVSDLRWVLDNVRWDMAADVGRVMPAPLQAAAVQAAGLLTRGLQRGARAVDAWWPKS